MIPDMAQDSTMQWLVLFMAQLMAFKLSSCLYQQVMCPAPPYHDKPFPKSGADHESSVIVFSTGVCSEPRFLQNSHVSYLASEYFLGALCVIRSIPGTLRACQPSISLCQHANYLYGVWSLTFAFLDLDKFGGNFDLWCCVCVMGTIMGPLRGTKQHCEE